MYGGVRGSALVVLLHLQLPFFHCLDKHDWDEEARYDKNKEGMKQAVFPSLMLRIENIMTLLFCALNVKISITTVKGRWYTTNDIALPAVGETHRKSIRTGARPSVSF